MNVSGPTGDVLVAFSCTQQTQDIWAVSYRFDGGGKELGGELGPGTYGGNNALWGSFAFGAHDELAYSYHDNDAPYETSRLRAPNGVKWDSFTYDPVLMGAQFGAIAVDALGNVFAASNTDLSIQLDAEITLPAAGEYILRGGPSGEAMYSNVPVGFTSTGHFVPDDQGGVFLYGSLPSTMDFGCGPLGASSGYVARLDASWSCLWASALPVAPSALSDGSGGVVLFATSAAPIDLGCGAMPAAAGGSTVVARLDAAGACVFGANFAAPNLGVALDANGQLVVSGLVGAFAVDLGGGPLAPIGAQDFVIGALDATGNHLWSRRFGGAGVTWNGAPSLSLTAVGDGYYVLAHYAGAIDFGGGAVTAATGDLTVASFTAAGAHRWSRALPIKGQYTPSVDGCGGLVVASVDAAFDLGCELVLPPNPSPYQAIAVARFQP